MNIWIVIKTNHRLDYHSDYISFVGDAKEKADQYISEHTSRDKGISFAVERYKINTPY